MRENAKLTFWFSLVFRIARPGFNLSIIDNFQNIMHAYMKMFYTY